MATTHPLKAETRQRSGSSAINRMRREGFIPAVIYGRGYENANLKINTRQISDLLRQSASDNVLVDLDIDDSAKSQLALIQSVQHDYLAGSIVHVDFHAIKEDEKIHASVPLQLTGTCIGVKNGGHLDHQLHSISVHCLPKDLPDVLEIDVSELDVDDSAHVSDMTVPDGVELALDGGVVIAMVQETRVAKAEAAEGAEEGEEGTEEGEEKSEGGEG